MDALRRSRLSKWIRGAQITHHEFIMFWQSVKVTLGLGTVLVVTTVMTFAWFELDHHERGIAFRSVLASGLVVAGVSKDYPIYYTNREGEELSVPARVFYESDTAKAVWEKAKKGMWRGFMVSVPVFVIALIAFVRMFAKAGTNQTDDSYIRGARLTKSGKELQKQLEAQGKIGPLPIGPIQLPHEYEAAHQLFIGGPGSGKTVLLSKQLEAIRKAGRRAIVYDINGTFVERFYDPNRDIILNPLEDRSPTWRIWDEVRLESDYHSFAQAIIPDATSGDTFWIEAARTTLRATLKKLAEDSGGEATNEDLYRALTKMPVKQFAAFLEGTEAGSIIDPGAEKMVIGIRATIASKLTGFSFLSDADRNGELLPENRRFSIKDFIQNEDQSGWLFITSKNDQLASLRHLITLWVDIAIGEVLSLKPDPARRLYFVFDELPSLSQLPSLQNAMAQGRKHGAAVVLGLQSIEQLRDIYGPKQAEAITGNCATWTTLRANDAETSRWISDAIGMTEKAETSEGLSVAGNDIGDRRTTNRQIVARATVLPSELRGLANLEGYAVLGRGHPVLKFDFPYEPYPSIAADFVMRPELLETKPASRGGFSSRPARGQPGLTAFSSPAVNTPETPSTAEKDDHEKARRREATAEKHRTAARADMEKQAHAHRPAHSSNRRTDDQGYGDLISRGERSGVSFSDITYVDDSSVTNDDIPNQNGEGQTTLFGNQSGATAEAKEPKKSATAQGESEDEWEVSPRGRPQTLPGMTDV
jgi:type IV conjugative transfer system coupling protein TraD